MRFSRHAYSAPALIWDFSMGPSTTRWLIGWCRAAGARATERRVSVLLVVPPPGNAENFGARCDPWPDLTYASVTCVSWALLLGRFLPFV